MLVFQLKKILLSLWYCISRIIHRDNKLILFSAWFGEKYADNSRFMFEFMLGREDFRVYWFTKNKDLYKELKSKNIPVLYSKSLKGKWYELRAGMMVSAIQYADFDAACISRVKFLDLDHGFPIKEVAFKSASTGVIWRLWQNFFRDNCDFYMTASSEFVANVVSECYNVPKSHFIKSNKPRIDVLFDSKLQESQNPIIEELKANHKLISYLPTHRSDGRVKMNINEIFDLDGIEQFCIKYDYVFIIKKHFYHNSEISDLVNYSRIFDLTQVPNIDTQILLAQTDILVTDYSSCFIDFLATDRPILFHQYDIEYFRERERGLYFQFDKNNVGYISYDGGTFTGNLEKISKDSFDVAHEYGRKETRLQYFDKDIEMGTSRSRIMHIMNDILNGNVINVWLNE